MILAIDIGNTNIVMGCFQDSKILFRERVSTKHTATDLEYAVTIKTALEMHHRNPQDIRGAIVSSVVPSVTNTFKRAIEKFCKVKPLVVGPGIKTGLKIRIDNPAQLGSDLVVDAVAGCQEYPAPMIIIDMGTATTMSVINEREEFVGGAIMPGLRLSLEALSSRASLLPHIDLIPPKSVIGRNTIDAMDSGMIYGTASMLDGMIDRIQEELGQPVQVIATGGLSQKVTPYCRHTITQDPNLLLKGLRILYYKNIK